MCVRARARAREYTCTHTHTASRISIYMRPTACTSRRDGLAGGDVSTPVDGFSKNGWRLRFVVTVREERRERDVTLRRTRDYDDGGGGLWDRWEG